MSKTPFHYLAIFSVGILFLCSFYPQNELDKSFTEVLKIGKQKEHINFDKAIALYEQAILESTIPAIKEQEFQDFIAIHLRLCEGYILRGQFEKANDIIQNLVSQQAAFDSRNQFDFLLKRINFWIREDAFTNKQEHADQIAKSLNIAQKIAKENPIFQKLLDTYWGSYYYQKGLTEKSISHFNKVINKTDNKDFAYVKGLLGLGKIKSDAGNQDSCILLCNQVLDLCQSLLLEKQLIIETHLVKALSYYRMGDAKAFLLSSKDALDTHEAFFSDNYVHVMRIYKLYGYALSRIGEHEKAYHYCQSGIAIAKKLNHQREQKGGMLNAGIIAAIFDNDLAIESNTQLKALLDPTTDRELYSKVCNNLANNYRVAGDFANSKKHNRLALTIRKQQAKALNNRNWTYLVGSSYFNLGQLYNDTKDFTTSQMMLDSCQLAWKDIWVDTKDISNLNYHYSLSLAGQGDYEKALNHCQKSIKALVNAYDENDLYAIPDIQNKIDYELQLIYPLTNKGKFLSILAKKNGQEQDRISASKNFQFTANLIDKIRFKLETHSSKTDLMKLAKNTFSEAINHAYLAYQSTGDSTFLIEAFDYAERSKSMVLNESLHNSKAKTGFLPDSLIQKEQELVKVLNALDAQLFSLNMKDTSQMSAAEKTLYFENLAETRKSLLTQQTQQVNFQKAIEEGFPKYYQLKYDLNLASIPTLKTNIPEHTVLIEYVLNDENLYIFSIKNKQVQLFHQPIDSTFYKELKRFREIFNTYQPKKFQSDAEKKAAIAQFSEPAFYLYQTLLAPVLKKETAQNLIIIPDGELGFVPFETLLTTEKNTQTSFSDLNYLFYDFNIAYDYSANLYVENINNAEEKNPLYDYLGMAPVCEKTNEEWTNNLSFVSRTGDETLALLPNSGLEITEVANLLSSGRYVAADAKKSVFLKNAPDSRILHLSTHGIVDDKNPLFNSYLVLAKDANDTTNYSQIHAYELANMNLSATELAVLSACDVGNGQLQTGEGIMSLAKSFKYAGCSNIAMNLWKADDKAAKDLVVNFFEHLKEGKGKATALKDARIHYLSNHSEEYLHPYFWSNLVLIGDNSAILLTKNSPWYASSFLLFLVGLLVLLSLFFLLKRKVMV